MNGIVELAAVIWKPLVKGWPVVARPFAFALALPLRLCATTLGRTAEPGGAPIVLQLQLPPSTSRETMRGLIADLAAKGVFRCLLLGRAALAFARVPILKGSADLVVWFALKWRRLITVLLIVVSPQRSDLRLLAIDDTDAQVCFRWVAAQEH